MNAETRILNNYFGLLNNLSPTLKLKLIEKLSKSISDSLLMKHDKIEDSFGAWNDSRNADQVIDEIKGSRLFNRKLDTSF